MSAAVVGDEGEPNVISGLGAKIQASRYPADVIRVTYRKILAQQNLWVDSGSGSRPKL